MEGYYTSQEKRLLDQFSRNLDTIKPILVEKFGESDAVLFRRECLQVYAAQIIPKIPYIGGKKNPFTVYLLQTSTAIAIYRAMQNRGKGLREAAEIVYRGMISVVMSMPSIVLRIYGLWMNSHLRYPRWRKEARSSQLREFPGDWVFTFVEGDGKSFDYGIDMQECGILKYLNAEGAGELAPYLCAVDYITHGAMGVELRRTQTLAFGCDKCDFRFIVRGNPTLPVWPPVFPEKNWGK